MKLVYQAEDQSLSLFFLLTFTISWLIPGMVLLLGIIFDFDVPIAEYSILYYLMVWSPSISAVILNWLNYGWEGVEKFFTRILDIARYGRIYVWILFGVSGMNLLAALLTNISGTPAFKIPQGPWLPIFWAGLWKFTAGPWEEPGWRGFALPRLQDRMDGLRASVFLGLIWGIWHVPAYVIGMGVLNRTYFGGLSWILLRFFVEIVSESIILTYIYNQTQGSIPHCMFFHGMMNFPYPWELDVDISTAQSGLLLIGAILIVLLKRDSYNFDLETDIP